MRRDISHRDRTGFLDSGPAGCVHRVSTPCGWDEVIRRARSVAVSRPRSNGKDRDEVAAIAAGWRNVRLSAAARLRPKADAGTAAGAQGHPLPVTVCSRVTTLWAIARENYGEGILFVRLVEANRDRIRKPRT